MLYCGTEVVHEASLLVYNEGGRGGVAPQKDTQQTQVKADRLCNECARRSLVLSNWEAGAGG
eukprot:166103-Chlamydomonas_euryale.AAC.1